MRLEEQKMLAPLTWMKVGGPADYYCEIKTREEIREAFDFAKSKNLPIVYLGQGSNLIFPDEGIRGLVLRLMNDQVEIAMEYQPDMALVTVDAGKILSKLIHECRKKGLKGLDNFVGIPGVVGAAIRGNIGIPSEQFGEVLQSVEVFDGKNFFELAPEECEFSYRESRLKKKYLLVWSARLLVKKGQAPKKDLWLLERITKQPKGNSCGSFFKNASGALFAGKLIEECGLKGKKIGGATISEKHGNFLMNDGTAKASEIVELARQVKQEVFAKKGIILENEVLLYNSAGQLLLL